MPPATESQPIMQHDPSAPRADYNSISPSIKATPDPSATTVPSQSQPTSSHPAATSTTTGIHDDDDPPTLQRRSTPSTRSKQPPPSPNNNTTTPDTPNPPAPSSKWHDLWEKYGSVELENKGSVARDHLALERTFLAWLRTSLSFASIGIAVTQLFRLNTSIASHSSSSSSPSSSPSSEEQKNMATIRHVGKPLGATFIFISILILAVGFHRYFEAQHYVIRGKFPASRASVVFVSGVAGLLIAASFLCVVVVGGARFES